MATTKNGRKGSAKGGEDKLMRVRAATFGQIVHVALKQIVVNPWQPRRMLDPDRVGELAESIHAHGLLQPPAGRLMEPEQGKGAIVQLAFGHYRVEAIRRLVDTGRWEGDVPMSIIDVDDAGMFMTALTENTARTELSQLETYQAYARALKEIEGLTIQGLADSIGVDRSTLSNNLRILDLPKVALDHVESGDMAPRAARELLAFKVGDHTHEREIAWIIERVDHTHLGSAPDWRTEHIRELVRDAIAHWDPEWRPLEGNEEDIEAYVYQGGFVREPSFDIEAFKALEPAPFIHTMPRRDGKTRVWTCNVKEWRRLQSAATRDANKAEGGPRPKDRSERGQERERQLKVAMGRDPLVKAVRASLPRAKRGAAGDLSDPEREQLGIRGNDAKVFGDKEFHESLGSLPDWWPDAAECLQTCSIGAAYGASHQGGKVQLYCTNKQNWNDKRSRGIAKLKEDLAITRAASDAEDARLVEVLAESLLPVEVARFTARALLATVNFRTTWPEGIPVHESRSVGALDYMPEILALALKSLEAKIHGEQWRDSMIERATSLVGLDKLRDEDVPTVAAQLVVWCVRHTHNTEAFKAAVEDFGPMDPKDAGVVAFNGDGPSLYYASLSDDHPTAHIIDGSKPLCGTEALAKGMVAHREVPEKVCARCEKVRAKREADAEVAS